MTRIVALLIAILIGQVGVIQADSNSSTQQASITGKVVDAKGESLPGVTILLKGTTIGTISDVNGKFSINASSKPQMGFWFFSFIGYKPKS